MSSMLRNGRNRNKGKFVMLRHDIMESTAYRALSTEARCVYHEVKYRFNGHNNGDIPLSCREAGELCGFSKSTASDAFNELLQKGFVRVAEQAGFNQKGGRRSRRWSLTEERNKGQPPTADWRKWQPEEN